MEGLIVLIALIPIALLILSIILLSKVNGLARDLDLTRKQLAEFVRTATVRPTPSQDAPRAEPAAAPPAPPAPAPPVVVPPPAAPAVPVEVKAPAPPVMDDAVQRMRALFPDADAPKAPPVVHAAPRAPVRPVQPPPRPGFFERHPDLEKFIGENLINKIGIAVLVLGVGLLLNFAIDQGLIDTVGQTLIGLSAGGLLVFFAHRLRTGYRAFSSVLIAGGIAVFYTTIAFAFHRYHLIGQTPAFLIMVVITGLAVLLTLAYDRKELAVISLLGGFAAPFLASSGEGNFKVLFTYLLILDAGMLVLANFKKWYVINVLSFVLTVLVFTGWCAIGYPDLTPRPVAMGFMFATAFFLVFFAMNLRYNLKHRQVFTALDHALLLANTAAYYAAGMYLLSDLAVRVTGLFTALLGLYYLLFALYFHRKQGIPGPLKLLLIGLVLTFISLAAPVQLEGNYITLFWAAEAVLLLWFSQRTGLRLVERASVLVSVLMTISLLLDLDAVYGRYISDEPLPILINKGWITGMAAAVSMFLSARLLSKEDAAHRLLPGLARSMWRNILLVACVVVLYITNLFELQVQLVRWVQPVVMEMACMAYSLAFVLVLERLARSTAARRAVLVLLTLLSLLYISAHYESSRSGLWMYLTQGTGRGFLVVHAIALVLMVVAVVRIAVLVRAFVRRPSAAWNAYLIAVSILLVIIASQELDHAMALYRGTTEGLHDARRVGYPILWGVGSFAFMWYGMRQRLRTMRIIALGLFAITLLKLFLFDLRDLSEGGRVAAFIFLGALLLVISFMYQKLKGLFAEDKTDAAPPAPEA